jgi:hypothetical protein
MQDSQEVSKHHENALQSVEMLRAVIGGDTYDGGRASVSRARQSSGASSQSPSNSPR